MQFTNTEKKRNDIVSVAYNCRHFRGDRPCQPHKQNGIKCDVCEFYDPVREQILIVKLSADGDVLRTTCLLPSLKEAYPQAVITWITESSAEPLLKNHPLIDRIWTLPERFMAPLMVEMFDLVINVDTDARSCCLAALAKSHEKRGFVAGEKGEILPLSEAAREWFLMGIRDDLKKANRRSYPEIIYEIAGLNGYIHGPELYLEPREIEHAKQHLIYCGWRPEVSRPVVGLNTGAGSRWPRKALPLGTLEKVIAGLLEIRPPVDVFLLGGPEEAEKNSYLTQLFSGLIVDTKTDNPKRLFAAIFSHVDVLVTADTLALHIAIALDKYVVAHFGPTSYQEIDTRNKGECILPKIDCICCYQTDCSCNPACNELISPSDLLVAVKRGLSRCTVGSI